MPRNRARRGQFFSSPRNPTDSRPLWISGCMGPDSDKYYEDQTFLTLNKLLTFITYIRMYEYECWLQKRYWQYYSVVPPRSIHQCTNIQEYSLLNYQSTIRIGYLVSSDMGLLVSDTNDHWFKECAKSKGDVKTEKCSISPIEDQSTDLHTSFFTWNISCLWSLFLQKEPTVGSGFHGCDVIDFPTAHVFNQFRYQLSDNQLRYEGKAKRLQSFWM